MYIIQYSHLKLYSCINGCVLHSVKDITVHTVCYYLGQGSVISLLYWQLTIIQKLTLILYNTVNSYWQPSEESQPHTSKIANLVTLALTDVQWLLYLQDHGCYNQVCFCSVSVSLLHFSFFFRYTICISGMSIDVVKVLYINVCICASKWVSEC